MANLTPEQAEAHRKLQHYKAKAVKFKRWAKRWRKFLLVRYAPRVAALGDPHFVKSLGSLLVSLSEPWEPSMNHLDTCLDRFAVNTTTELLLELFVEDVRKAERLKL